MKYTTRPISVWPAGVTVARRNSPFKASYGVSEDLLMRELWQLGARDVVLEIDISATDLRLDGTLRANARPQGPRVVLYAETKHGPLMMPCATFAHWQDNIRAIALSLEALRKVDRYGCSQRGEQYRGWTAIPASTSVTTRVEAAWTLLADEAGRPDGFTIVPGPDERTRQGLNELFTCAAKVAHPDAGGTDERMAAVNRARETILADLAP